MGAGGIFSDVSDGRVRAFVRLCELACQLWRLHRGVWSRWSGEGCSQSVQQHRVVGGHLPETFTEQREWPPTPEGAGESRSSVHSLREETSGVGFPFVRSLLLKVAVDTTGVTHRDGPRRSEGGTWQMAGLL